MAGSRKYGGNQASRTTFPCTWQFNFKFSLKEDMFAQQSIDSLVQNGVDFSLLERDGIEPFDFASLLLSSGLVCDEDVHWISFHGAYDFGYLTKCLLCQQLPDDEIEFDMLMKKFFPSVYDIKYIVKNATKQHSMGQLTPSDASTSDILAKFEQKLGLDQMAETLKIKRLGPLHQAGSDSFVTGKVFFAMREKIFKGEMPDEYLGQVWGIGIQEGSSVGPQHSTPQQYHQQLQENATPNQNGGSAYANGGPSTPNNPHVGLANTPVHANNVNIGPLTPGGGGGVFGAFQFGKQ